MDLWQGSLSEFLRAADSRSLPAEMAGSFLKLHRYLPGHSEVRSWENSLAALAQAIRPLRTANIGMALASPSAIEPAGSVRDASSTLGLSLEYHLPLSAKRVDVLLTGHDTTGQPAAMVVELKQWSDVRLEDEHATNVLVLDQEHVHPSEQAVDYAEWLADYHSAFTDGAMVAAPLAYCHELRSSGAAALRDRRFDDLLRRSPLFARGEESALTEHISSQVGGGDGVRLLKRLSGPFQPSKRVLDNLEAVLNAREEWHLLDEQRLAFNAILDEVRRQQARAGRSVVVVRGAPGTGKTVIAIQLLAAALRLGWRAAHSTGGKAFIRMHVARALEGLQA